jgi:Rieske Fe-S protein
MAENPIGRPALPSAKAPVGPRARGGLLLAGGLVFVAVVVVAVIAAVQFLDPDNTVEPPGEVLLDAPESYVVGGVYRDARNHILLVRLEDRRDASGAMVPTFRAFADTDPRNGCTLAPAPAFFSEQTWARKARSPEAAFSEDALREPCHASTYDLTGRRVFGPSPFNLNEYEASVQGGAVRVHLGRKSCSLAEGIQWDSRPPEDECGPGRLP